MKTMCNPCFPDLYFLCLLHAHHNSLNIDELYMNRNVYEHTHCKVGWKKFPMEAV